MRTHPPDLCPMALDIQDLQRRESLKRESKDAYLLRPVDLKRVRFPLHEAEVGAYKIARPLCTTGGLTIEALYGDDAYPCKCEGFCQCD